MKNRKLIATVAVLPFLGLTYLTSASYDCSTLNMQDLKTILDKQHNWKTLTDDEQTVLDNVKSCIPTWSWKDMKMWSWTMNMWKDFRMMNWSGANIPEMTDEQKAQMEEVKTIIEKKKNWETLTDEEQIILNQYEANRHSMWSWSIDKKRDNQQKTISSYKISNSYKTKIDSAVNSVFKWLDSYSDDDKLTLLNKLKNNIEKKQTNVSNSSYSDTKKSAYSNIFSYMLELINDEIDNVNWKTDDSDADSLIEDLFE